MDDLTSFLNQHAVDGLLSAKLLESATTRFKQSHAALERRALELELLPSRYQRNRTTISVRQQLQLFNSRVAVVGCGGLGGYIIEELSRLGIGELVVIDPDCFEEHNLNRQLLSTPAALGQAKVTLAARRVAEVNPAVTVHPLMEALSASNGNALLAGAAVVADAVDNIPTRLALADCCRELQIPMVHGAIAGWYGYVCTVFPGDDALEKIYPNRNQEGGIEQQLGTPAFTPAVVASLEVAEICKILLGKGELLRHRRLAIDLLNMEIEESPL